MLPTIHIPRPDQVSFLLHFNPQSKASLSIDDPYPSKLNISAGPVLSVFAEALLGRGRNSLPVSALPSFAAQRILLADIDKPNSTAHGTIIIIILYLADNGM